MSADRWSVCPRCLHRARHKADEDRARVMATYGQVPVEEFDSARAELRDPDPDNFVTFREDYELYGVSEGEIKADYAGACGACGLAVRLEASKRFWSPQDVDA